MSFLSADIAIASALLVRPLTKEKEDLRIYISQAFGRARQCSAVLREAWTNLLEPRRARKA